jgi:glycosyltransferase involved in cell wall biosynthesis
MKIAIICYYHIDATISLVKYLKQRDKDLEIDFICLFNQYDKKATPISFPDVKVRNGFLNQNDILKVVDQEVFNYLRGVANLKIFIFNSYKIFDLRNFIQLIQLRNNLIKEGYSVINFVGNSHLVIFLNILTKIKVKFHTIHEPYPHHESYSKRELFKRKTLLKLLAKSGCHITVPSVVSFNRFIDKWEINQTKISIVYFSLFEIYNEYLKKEIPKSDNIILFYGIINKYKGVEVLIDAMKKVISVLPDLKLIIAGNGRINCDLAALSKNFEIINRYITNEEIAELNQAATLVVCPYFSASQSGVVMTSYAFNNPILATKVGAIPEFVEDGKTGVLIDYSDADVLALKIIEIFNDKFKIEEFRANILDKYSKTENSWENIADTYYKLIQSAISQTS